MMDVYVVLYVMDDGNYIDFDMVGVADGLSMAKMLAAADLHRRHATLTDAHLQWRDTNVGYVSGRIMSATFDHIAGFASYEIYECLLVKEVEA